MRVTYLRWVQVADLAIFLAAYPWVSSTIVKKYNLIVMSA